MGYFGCEYCNEANVMFDESHVCDVKILREELDKYKKENIELRTRLENCLASVQTFFRDSLSGKSPEYIEELFRGELNRDVLIKATQIKNLAESFDSFLFSEEEIKKIGYCSVAHKKVLEDSAFLNVLCSALDLFRSNKIKDWHSFEGESLKTLLLELFDDCQLALKRVKWNNVKIVSPEDKESFVYRDFQRLCK